jgi:hypothetical protein
MLSACIANRSRPNGLHRLGVTTHVYADTWAHRDFVGLDHPFNHVRGLIHDEPGLHALGEDVQSRLAGTFPIGHGMVLTLPDQPFLSWGYFDRDGNRNRRDNTEMFMSASERIVAFHHVYRGEDGAQKIFAQDRDVLQDAFARFNHEDGDARHKDWMSLLRQGRFTFGPLSAQEFSELQYVPKGRGSWKYEALKTEAEKDDPSEMFDWSPAFDTSDWKLFHDALKEHRAEVLERILPTYQLDPSNC